MLKKFVQQGRSELSLYKGLGGLIPTARNILTRPPTGMPRRASGPGEGLQIPPTSPEEVGRLFFTARIERPPLYRGGSASKKNGLPAPSHPSEAARCASKGIVPATPSPLFQHPTRNVMEVGRQEEGPASLLCFMPYPR